MFNLLKITPFDGHAQGPVHQLYLWVYISQLKVLLTPYNGASPYKVSLLIHMACFIKGGGENVNTIEIRSGAVICLFALLGEIFMLPIRHNAIHYFRRSKIFYYRN